MRVTKLFITITSRPLHEAIASDLPAVQAEVQLGETTPTDLMALMQESVKHMGGA